MKLRPFELALVIIFTVLLVLSLVLISTHKASTNATASGLTGVIGTVQIWGTLPDYGVEPILEELRDEDDKYDFVTYKYIQADQFDAELLAALADGEGPDIILTSQEKLVDMRKRIQPISYESLPLPDIQNLYVDGAGIFALSDGMYAYPIAIDPLMMYWNKDIIATEGFLAAPTTWEEFVNTMFPDLIKRDFSRTIERGVIAMGEYDNVRNAFGALSALIIQGGTEIVTETASDKYLIKIRSSVSGDDPLVAAADFYTRFSKPSNALYSWNRSYEEDRSEFTGGNLAFYLGYGSEALLVEKLNPNLSFGLAEIPQGESATVRRTYARFYGLSLLNSADNKNGAKNIMLTLSSAVVAPKIAISCSMVPAHRSAISAGSNNIYGRATYKSATIARGWLNPNLEVSNDIFKTMTEDINENRRTLDGATSDVELRLQKAY